MKAIVQNEYGAPERVLEPRETEEPVPRGDEVLVRVRAASVNAQDWHIARGLPYFTRLVGAGLGFGLRGPRRRIRGEDLAGTVEAVGQEVTQFRPGDEVYGRSVGSFAEYTCAPEDSLAPKPANLTFEQAAAVPLAANTALQGLRDRGQIQPGQRVLINGAGRGVGTFAVQIAKSFGADVTGVCSTGKVELVRSLGADGVIDYTREDFTRSGQRYDLLFDLVANRSLSDCRRALTPEGTLVLSGGEGGRWVGPLGLLFAALVTSPFVRQRLLSLQQARSKENLIFLKELIEAGLVRPVVDRTYPLGEVARAVEYLESGQARGKVVIAV